MNRKIKSGEEIEKEIELIFETCKDDNKLANKIVAYVNTITGKELIKTCEIKKILFFFIINHDIAKGSSLRKSKRLQKIFPNLISFYEMAINLDGTKNINACPLMECEVAVERNINEGIELYNNEITNHFFLLMDMLSLCNGFEKYRNPDSLDSFTRVCKENKTFNKLFTFIANNKKVSVLINDYLYESRRHFLVNLVIKKIIPLNSIFVYFDRGKTIKENTEFFYELLQNKVSRITIQTAIQDNLKKIKKDKYAVGPFLLSDLKR